VLAGELGVPMLSVQGMPGQACKIFEDRQFSEVLAGVQVSDDGLNS